MSHVLLAVDGSDPALRAEEYLAREMDPSGDQVLVLTVARVPEEALGYTGAAGHEAQMLGLEPEAVHEEFLERARDVAEDAATRLRAEGFDVEVSVRAGNPGMVICNRAAEEDVDCIVMGRRGRGRVREVLLGSVSHYVVHHAPCPVTVVPATGNEEEGRG